MFRWDEVVKRSVLKELEQTAAEMLKRKAVRDGMKRLDAKCQAAIARLQKKRYEKMEFTSRSTPVLFERSRGDKRHRAGSSNVGSERDSLKASERRCNRKK